MKVKYVATAASLAAVMVLSACGGKETFEISGTVTTPSGAPIANSGLVLQNGSDTVSVGLGQNTFAFPNRVSYGTEYNVTVKTQPNHMTCGVSNPHGSAGQTTSIQIVVTCTQNTYTVGGTVNNLKVADLVIINGSNSSPTTIPKDATTFTYGGAIPVGVAYGLTVLTQPNDGKGATQTCTIINGTDVMGDANRTNVVINCQ